MNTSPRLERDGWHVTVNGVEYIEDSMLSAVIRELGGSPMPLPPMPRIDG